MPKPPIIRKMTSCVRSEQTAHPMADTENIRAEISIVFFRPRKSLSIPATSTPTIDPISAQPTYQPLASSSRENCPATMSVVPEMTAVS